MKELHTNTSNNRIAKNTIILYLRMLFSMGITLYTSRVILHILGIEDYGIYNVVGGLVSLFTVISGAMQTSSQRYITFALGKGDKGHLKCVFSNSVLIHIILAIVIFILVETIGLWLLFNKLVIPSDRIDAAFWVMQCSLLSVAIGIWSVPYNAVIIAHEQMSAFAYISIIDVILRLVIVLVLPYCNIDRLILYAILLLSVQLLMRFIYGQYSYRHFEETHFNFSNDKKLFKEMLSFAGWSMIGTVSGALYTQGINILLNLFFGPIVNAARGIAVQVQGAVQQFVNNFQMAVNPQITKSYANEEFGRLNNLIYLCSKFSFFLLLAMILPLLIKTEFVFKLWLHEEPDWSVPFTRMLLLIVLIDAMSNPFITAVQATGEVRTYQIVINCIQLFFFPFTYIVLKLGCTPNMVFVVQLVSCIATYIARVMLSKRMIRISVRELIKYVWVKVIIVSAVSVVVPITLNGMITNTLFNNCLIIIASIISVLLSAFFFGLSHKESQYIIGKVQNIISKISK